MGFSNARVGIAVYVQICTQLHFKVSKNTGLNPCCAFYQYIGDFRNGLHCDAWRRPEVSPFSILALSISRPLA